MRGESSRAEGSESNKAAVGAAQSGHGQLSGQSGFDGSAGFSEDGAWWAGTLPLHFWQQGEPFETPGG